MAQLGSSKVFGNLQVTGNIVAGTTITGTTLSISGTATAVTFSGALSGNATTATTLQTARTINLVSFNGSQNITLTKLYSIDDRTLAPADTNTRYLEFGFGAWNNNNTGPFADFLNMRSYSDSSGGNDNVLMLRKDAIGMRIYQQSFGSTTAYASYRDVAFTDSPAFTGQVVVAAGTSAAPAIAPTGDTNTGIFFPAADTIAFGEGGTEVMRITSAGNVGIGTASPTPNASRNTLSINGAQGGVLELFTAGTLSYQLYPSSSVNPELINYNVTNNLGTHIFSVNGTERMRLTSAGHLGVGTASPTEKLQVNATSGNVGLNINTADAGAVSYISLSNTGASGKRYSLNVGGNTIGSGLTNNLFLYDNDNAAVRFLITPSGNVGIGTTSPSYTLDANGIVRAKNAFYIGRSTDSAVIGSVKEGTSNGLKIQAEAGGTDSTITFATNGGDRAIITSAGNVGIGTTSPVVRLDLGGSIGEKLNLYTGGVNRIGFGVDMGQTINGLSSFTNSAFNWGIWDGTTFTERMRLNSSGNLGIGTATPAALLDLYSSAARIKFNRGNAYNLSFGIHDSSTSGLSIKDFNDANTLVYFDYTGNVGIGTTSLNQTNYGGRALSISASNDSVVEIISTSANTDLKTIGALQFANAGSGITGKAAASVFSTQSGTNATNPGAILGFATRSDGGSSMTERMRITSSGNVGIGTTNPTAKLEVVGGASLSGTLTFNGSTGSSGQVLTSQGSSAPIWSNAGTGTVTSVAMTVPAILSVSGTPITTSGTFAVSLVNQNANLVFAGPATGAATTPTFRSLTIADIPNLGTSYLNLSGGSLTGAVTSTSTISGTGLISTSGITIAGAIAQGLGVIASGTYASAFGSTTVADGISAHAEGDSNAAASSYSHAEGRYNLASHGVFYTITAFNDTGKTLTLASTTGLTLGDTIQIYRLDSAPIIGITIAAVSGNIITLNTTQTITSSWKYLVEKRAAALQYPLHVEGYNNIASGRGAHAEGYNTIASSDYGSHSEGYNTTSSGGYGSHAEGWGTTASGAGAHAEGSNTVASLDYAHAEGESTTASGYFSHAEGSGTVASGHRSHAEGSVSTASGYISHAEGNQTVASGDHSHAAGLGTIAQGQNQTAIGKYNVAQGTTNSLINTDNAFIIGNGTSGATRSNAVSINWNGGATFAGTISAATPTASNHVALKSNVDDAVAIAWLGL